MIIVLITLGVSLRLINLNNVTMRSPDEGVYTYQARIISADGPVAGTRALVREYNQAPQLWIYPPPTRIGYDWLLGGIMKLSGTNTEKTGAYLSFAASILSLVLTALIGLRFFNPLTTFFALLFMAVSPMDLAVSRRSWQDALFGFLGISMVYYVLKITKDAKGLLWYALLIATGMYIVLVKEPGIAVYGLCSLWVIWVLAVKERSLAKTLIFIAASAASLVASYGLISYSVGGVDTLLTIFRHVKEAMPTNDYAIEYQSGPWANFISGLWILSPLSSLLFIFGIIGSLLPIAPTPDNNSDMKPYAAWLIIFGVAFFSIALVTPYCQNYRYVSVTYVPFYLVAGLGLRQIVSRVKPLVKGILIVAIPILAAVLIFAALRDYRMYEKIFLRTGIVDISVKMVRDLSK